MTCENAALYRRNLTAANRPALSRLADCLLLGLCLWLTACRNDTPKTDAVDQPPGSAQPLPKSSVPLRLWIVGEGDELTIIQRQWQATYDRTIEIQSFTITQLLEQSKPQCDVLIYPAGLLGELVARQWLAELPPALQTQPIALENNDSPASLPAGWLDQARYARKLWGVSLSVVTPIIAANFPLPPPPGAADSEATAAQQSRVYWQTVIAALKEHLAQRREQPAVDATSAIASATTFDDAKPTQLDPAAVVDRFLTIFNSLHISAGRVGVMFDPETLQPRINQPDALAALKLMQEFSAAGVSPAALLGSHLSAWNALSNPAPNLTICVPPPPTAESDAAIEFSIEAPPANPLRAGAQASASTNVGLGLIASLTTQCQQTSTSIELVRWLASEPSRQSFGKRIAGLSTESAYAPGSSAWKAQRLVQRLGQYSRLPSEPRLAHSLSFRQALGEEIATCLQGGQSAEAALAAVERRWSEIIARLDRDELRKSYHQSLGL